MSPVFSVYLDLLRLLSALAVFIAHLKYERFTNGWLGFFGDGNYAVMVFFVLSGYVICYVANEKEATPYEFTVSRLARLYSVVIPAILLTAFFDLTGPRFDRALYDGWWYQDSHILVRLFANSFFIQELWFFSVRPLSNGPFWSLGYEFWYYFIFAILFYRPGRSWWLWALFACLIAGPKILLLAPVWLMGVGAYYFNRTVRLRWEFGLAFFLISLPGYLLYLHLDAPLHLKSLTHSILGESVSQLQWSKRFFENYLIGALVTLNIIGFSAYAEKLKGVARIFGNPVKFLASYTFTLYLVHYPALHFFAAVSSHDPRDPIDQALLITSTLLLCFLVGTYTERKKHVLKTALNSCFHRFFSLKRGNAVG